MRQKRGRLVGVARCGDSEMTLVEKGIGMAHKLALALALIIMCANIAGAQQQKPLHLVKPSAWADMTEREKELYVTGVLEGWSFNLYGTQHPDLVPLVQCVRKEGIKKIVRSTQNAMLLGEARNPAPWWVARAFGVVCKKYRSKR